MRILFCGVGAVGSTAATLCRSLPDVQLAFLDFDRVESKNLAGQAFVKASLGRHKAEALKLQFSNLHGVKADAHPVRLTAENVAVLAGSAGLLVDAFDNAASRRLLQEHARGTGQALIHAALSADGTFGLVRWDDTFVADEEDHAGQATCEGGEHLPMIGLLAAVLARAIQDFAADGTRWGALVTRRGVTLTP